MNVFDGQFLHGLSKFFPGMPTRAVYAPLPPLSSHSRLYRLSNPGTNRPAA